MVMRTLLALTVVSGSLVASFFLVQLRPAGAAANPAKGKGLYEKYCVACHGAQGKGDGPAGRMLKPPAADFTSAGSKKTPESGFTQGIENGKPGTAMGPWKGQLSQAELADLIGYVMTLRK